MITGTMQTTFGIHQHRSSRGDVKIFLPDTVKKITELFLQNGYSTVLISFEYHPKSDYTFIWDPGMHDKREPIKTENGFDTPCNQAGKDQPWFAQIQLAGGYNRQSKLDQLPDLAKVSISPYYPNDRIFRTNQAKYLGAVLNTDLQVKIIIEYLKYSGQWENKIVFFITDHGQSHDRHKQWLYVGGIHVPLIVAGKDIKPSTNHELFSLLDVVGALLDLAGTTIPSYMDAINLLTSNGHKFVISARDRCDWTIDRIRSVCTDNFKYIRNFYPQLSYLQSTYRDNWVAQKRAWEMYNNRELRPIQALYFEQNRPEEELYFSPKDSHEINNLARGPDYQEIVDSMRLILEHWMNETNDQGAYKESEKSYKEALKHVNGKEITNYRVIVRASRLRNSVVSLELENALIFDIPLYDQHKEQIEIPTDSCRITFKSSYPFRNITQHFEEVVNYRRESAYTTNTIDDNWHEIDLQHDEKARFRTWYDMQQLHIEVEVEDSEIVVDSLQDPWNQDGIEIRMDSHMRMERGSSYTPQEFQDYIAIITSPGANGKPSSRYLSALGERCCSNFYQSDLKVEHSFTQTGHQMTAKIPVDYLKNQQNGIWESFRLNIHIHDKDSESEFHTTWKTDWRDQHNYQHSGTFSRED